MADPRPVELDELVNRPGMYFKPHTEVLLIVDDTPDADAEMLNMDRFEGADWVLISDESAIDETRRDELLEAFQVHYHAGNLNSIEGDVEEDDDELEEDDQEVGRE